MEKFFKLICVAIGIGFPMANSFNQSQEEQRSLLLYEHAGPFALTNDLTSHARSRIEAQIRGFLWSHWQDRKLGYTVVTRYSKEGAPTTIAYFVEPDKEGKWSISFTLTRTVIDLQGRLPAREEITNSIAYKVERFAKTASSSERSEEIIATAILQPTSYVLVLKDSHGKIIHQI